MSGSRAIVRQRGLCVASLDARARAELLGPLSNIVAYWFEGMSREEIAERLVFRAPGARLRLFYAEDGELVGFSSISVERLVVDGHRYAVFDIGTHLLPEVERAGASSSRAVLFEVLRMQLRYPRYEPVLIGFSSTPSSYRLAHRQSPFLHPRPNVQIPARIETLAIEYSKRRGHRPRAPADPWVVCPFASARVRRPDRIHGSERLAKDPHARFFTHRNPGWSEGDWLVVYIPLGLRYVLARDIPPLRRLMGALK